MPDAYGNYKPISVPMLPWLQVFEPGQRVRITATQQLGVVRPKPGSARLVLVKLDDTPIVQHYAPGELRPVPFDPGAAGRRAAEKHADALRRLGGDSA